MNAANWLARAAELRREGKIAEAAAACQAAIELEPKNAQGHHSLAQLLRQSGDLEGALREAQVCVNLAPEVAAAWGTLGVAQMELGELAAAEASLRKALKLSSGSSGNTGLEFNLAEVLLLGGKFEEAWNYFEAGRMVGNAAKRVNLGRREWDGKESLVGKRILIYSDAGFGDAIQFVRYARVLRERGAREVVVICQPELAELFRNAAGVSEVVSLERTMPGFDLVAPMMSLPRLTGTTVGSIPAEVPYLFAEPMPEKKWRERLEGLEGKKVGIAWAGRRTHANDFQRSIPMETLRSVLEMRDVTFVSLQKGRDEPARERNLVDWSADLTDFAETAALVANLDLVVSVDTSVAHLAGAMGKKVWTMLLFAPDWRWMLGREDSPWYPTMRLLRQERAGDWASVIERVRRELGSVAAEG